MGTRSLLAMTICVAAGCATHTPPAAERPPITGTKRSRSIGVRRTWCRA